MYASANEPTAFSAMPAAKQYHAAGVCRRRADPATTPAAARPIPTFHAVWAHVSIGMTR
jgi:hypothetical protein